MPVAARETKLNRHLTGVKRQTPRAIRQVEHSFDGAATGCVHTTRCMSALRAYVR